MNLLTVLLVLFSKVYSTSDNACVTTAYYVEHNFWELNEKLPDINKKKLWSVKIKKEDEEKYICTVNWPNNLHYRYDLNNLFYSRVSREDFKNFTQVLQSSKKNKVNLKFEYYYTDKSYDYAYRNKAFTRNLECFKNFKIIESRKGNIIEMFNDKPSNIFVHHVDDNLKRLFADGLLMLNNKLLKEWVGDFDEKPNFKLFYFKNFSDCLKDLKIFLNNLNYLVLIDDTLNLNTDICSQQTNILKLSCFYDFFKRQFVEDFENRNLDFYEKQNFNLIYTNYVDSVKNGLLNNEIFLPLDKKYTIEYHLEQLYASIIKKACITQENCICPIRYQSNRASSRFFNPIRHSNVEMKKITLKDLFNHESILKYFFNEKNITSKDYVELDKIVCDFYNLIKFLSEKFEIQCLKENKAYTKPIFIDNYKCMIVGGIKIEFIDNSGKDKIKAYDNEGKEITIEEGVDYKNLSKSLFFIPFENILNKSIQEFRVFSENESFQTFKIKKNFRIERVNYSKTNI